MKKHRGAKKQISAPLMIVYQVIFSLVLLAVLSMLSSILLSVMKNPTANIKLFSLITLLACAAISGFAISRYNESFLSSVSVTLIFTALMIAISLISTKGAVGGGVFMNYICYILVALFSAFAGRKKEKRRRR